jgi:GH24 family phage-related lysozyme (muramidase)
MRRLILESSSTIKYHLPFVRSYGAVAYGFTPEEIEEIKELISGGSSNREEEYSTEIVFDKDRLVPLINSGQTNLSSSVDEVDIRTDLDSDPVTGDLSSIIKSKINSKIGANKSVEDSQEDQKDAASVAVETSSLSASQTLIDMLKEFEGFRSYPYTCPGGSLTIGYGNTIKPGEYTSITKEQAEALLRKTVSSFEAAVKKMVTVPLSQNQYDALVSLAYNIGAGALRKSTLIKKLNTGDYKGAADEFLRFVKANGKTMEGLVKRRERERNLFLS